MRQTLCYLIRGYLQQETVVVDRRYDYELGGKLAQY